MNLLDNELVRCPTCKDNDCVESERIDRCSACGWMQVVPLESKPTHEPEKNQRQICLCGVPEANGNHTPMGCTQNQNVFNPKDEVEEKIEAVAQLAFPNMKNTKEVFIPYLRELVELARKK